MDLNAVGQAVSGVLAFLADIFVNIGAALSGWLVNLGAPQWVVDLVVVGLAAAIMATMVLLSLVINIWVERKVGARLQDRIGPNRVGPWGIFQTVADLGKLLTKEIILPSGADVVPYMIAPIIGVLSVLMIWAVVPFAPTTIGTNVNIGVLYIMAVSSLGLVAILMAGWSSNNKYALMGAFRAVAMLVSYEVPMVIALMIPVMLAGSMAVNDLVASQGIAYIFAAPVAGLIFLIASTAEVGRQPFDVLEAESEIVAGYSIEYSGFAFAMWYAAEWAHGFTICALMATLFLGGWRGPFVEQVPILGLVYFLLKTYIVYLVQIWVRFTVPRLRIDQIMSFCWKFLVPVSLLLLVLMAVVDKAALAVVPGYLSQETLWAMLPRSGLMLLVNVAVGGVIVWWIVRQGQIEREKAAGRMLVHQADLRPIAPIETGTD